ncbi:hypothetical protein BDV98DRAFT_593285 [Pterulicium gracile]|uniref:Uncharacterized protein n=1 Tax=Pterulicium gracile TaxID=1884261 RepID=A0A5C3QJS5_9AGAR|nr:hypothetical protein BDV98DRAFT_593285 [Pterula gracilis]
MASVSVPLWFFKQSSSSNARPVSAGPDVWISIAAVNGEKFPLKFAGFSPTKDVSQYVALWNAMIVIEHLGAMHKALTESGQGQWGVGKNAPNSWTAMVLVACTRAPSRENGHFSGKG